MRSCMSVDISEHRRRTCSCTALPLSRLQLLVTSASQHTMTGASQHTMLGCGAHSSHILAMITRDVCQSS
jgi:hypothetical protein